MQTITIFGRVYRSDNLAGPAIPLAEMCRPVRPLTPARTQSRLPRTLQDVFASSEKANGSKVLACSR